MEIYDELKDYKLIPLHNNSKIPKKGIKWGTDETLTFDGSETGYAIDTGRSNLVVIDCDSKNDDVNGVTNFFDLVRDHEEIGFPETFSVETPNNGLHFYYKLPDGAQIKSSVSQLAPGIDVRSHGGYIVGPGSKVVDNDGVVKEYIIIDENATIMELPEWLMKKLSISKAKNSSKKSKASKEYHNSSENNNDEIEQRNALVWALDKISNAQTGERNNILNHTAYFMGLKKVNEIDARQLIEEAVSKGLILEEAEKTFATAYAKGLLEETTSLDSIIKEYNTKTNTSFKDDPMDTEFYSHVSLSYNFWKKYRDEIIFWDNNKLWYRYDSTLGIWKIVSEEALRGLVKNFLEQLVADIRLNKANKIPVSVYKMQERVWAKSNIDSVAVLARSDFINDTANLFDSNPQLINANNGTFDLKKGELLNHSKDYYITKNIPFNIDLNAKDEYFNKVIESAHPEELDYLQLFAGQSLTGYQPNLQVALFLFGRGSNGKSTFIDLMLRTSGTYGKLQHSNILQLEPGKENYAMADFDGLRTVVVEELPDSKQLNSGTLKRLVGTEKINARPIYGSNREFINQSTIFVSCNRLPMVNETDDGTWRRLLVFNFPYSYKKNPKEVLTEWDKLGDPMVIFAARKKTTTAEAFLAWRIKGAMKWFSNIHIENNVPDTITQTVMQWNENNDLFLAWFNDTLESNVNSIILLQDAFNSYNNWASKRGNSTLSLRYFIANFTNHKTFYNSKAKYVSRGTVLKAYNHSSWNNPDNPDEIPRIPNKQDSFFVNLAFK